MADDPLSRYKVPVSPDAPAGDDLTYDEAYLRIREEIDRAGTVSVHVDHEKALEGAGSGTDSGVDFASLADSARQLLSGPTRDLQLAAYLTFALVRDRGAHGLAEGLDVTRVLLEAFGEVVHPLKPLRRRNALQYLAERVTESITDRSFTAGDVGALQAAREAGGAIQEWTTKEMGDDAPALSGMLQALDEALRKAQRAEKSAEVKATPTNGAGAARPAAPVATAAPASIASMSDARRAVAQAAAFLRDQDPNSPHAFRLTRALAWGGLTAPPANEAGRTVIEPPDAASRARFDQIAEPAARLRAAEETFSSRPLWLDLQRIAAQSAEQGGPGLAGVRAAVVEETAALLRRVPELASLSFSDGTPLADASTRGWLDSLVQETAGQAGMGPAAGVDDALKEILEAARAQAAAGDVPAAIRTLQESSGGRAGRGRFHRTLHVARLCQQAGRADVAMALLDGLVDEIDRRGLAEWEPDLALDCLRLAHAASTAAEAVAPAAEKETARARARAVYALLCRLDPAEALGIAASSDKKGGRG